MRFAILSMLLASAAAFAADLAPRAPCGADPVPAPAPVGAPPAWMARTSNALIDAPCADELATPFRAIVTLSGSFRYAGDINGLLERLGAVSRMKGIRYWSVSDQRWAELILASRALEGLGGPARADFSAAELLSGKEVVYAQTDNRSDAEVTFRMRVTVRNRDEITVQIRNLTPVRSFLVTAYAAGDLRTVHFLRRRSADVWDYYLASAVRESWLSVQEASLANRAAAMYRYIAGQRTDEEPPLARE